MNVHFASGAGSRQIRSALLVVLTALLAFSIHPAGAQSSEPARVRIASASVLLPVQVALSQGYFAEEQLDVVATQFTSARTAFEQLARDEFEMLVTSADNPGNYRFNPNSPLGTTLDVQIIFGNDRGFGISLFATPGVTSFEDLRGRALGVDDPASGFAITLYKLMRQHGMEAGVDYDVLTVGGTPVRLAALRAGQVDAALLNSDSAVRARSEGFTVLAGVTDVASPYMGGLGVARESWLKAHPDTATRFIRGFQRGMRWLTDPAHRGDAIALFTNANTPAALAELVYQAALDPVTGLAADARLSVAGLQNVLELRFEFGGFGVPLDLDALIAPASGLYDLSYYWSAAGQPDPYRLCGP